MDFDTNYSKRQVFLENFLAQLAVVPGTVITAMLVDKVGRVRLLSKYRMYMLIIRLIAGSLHSPHRPL